MEGRRKILGTNAYEAPNGVATLLFDSGGVNAALPSGTALITIENIHASAAIEIASKTVAGVAPTAGASAMGKIAAGGARQFAAGVANLQNLYVASVGADVPFVIWYEGPERA